MPRATKKNYQITDRTPYFNPSNPCILHIISDPIPNDAVGDMDLPDNPPAFSRHHMLVDMTWAKQDANPIYRHIIDTYYGDNNAFPARYMIFDITVDHYLPYMNAVDTLFEFCSELLSPQDDVAILDISTDSWAEIQIEMRSYRHDLLIDEHGGCRASTVLCMPTYNRYQSQNMPITIYGYH
jgi:hypothetical protein